MRFWTTQTKAVVHRKDVVSKMDNLNILPGLFDLLIFVLVWWICFVFKHCYSINSVRQPFCNTSKSLEMQYGSCSSVIWILGDTEKIYAKQNWHTSTWSKYPWNPDQQPPCTSTVHCGHCTAFQKQIQCKTNHCCVCISSSLCTTYIPPRSDWPSSVQVANCGHLCRPDIVGA